MNTLATVCYTQTMNRNIFQFIKVALKNYAEAATNLLLFFPYFFSVTALLKTLFSPWKNLIVKKTIAGFSFNDWLNRFFFNTISRVIGLIMRLCILTFFLLLQILYLFILPISFIAYLCILPIVYIESLFQKTEGQKKKIIHDAFISNHCLEQKNMPIVEHWFSIYYQKHVRKNTWWKLSNLFSFPPLVRDWSVGFTPALDNYCDDLTASSYQREREHIVDRQKEIHSIETELSKTEEANVIIVGEEGVGKHTIVDALAKNMYEGKINNPLIYKRVLMLRMEKILTQFTDINQREDFFNTLLEEADEAKNIIIVINNIEKYIASGPESVDLSGSIERFAKHGSIHMIGITTPYNHEKTVIRNDKIQRLFTKIDVYEISDREAEEIIMNIAYLYENKYTLSIPYETIHDAIDKSSNYITSIPFPEKAIRLLDSTCAYAKEQRKIIVLPEYVDLIISEQTHVPTIISLQMKEKLLRLEALLTTRIIQQTEAIKKISSSMRRSFIYIGKRKKPLASFLFLGPTGVGKTETAKALADVFFGSESYLIRFDMSEFQNKLDIGKLIGSMESGNPGLLTAAIRQHSYGVLLLDELEKADPQLLNIFLTIFDEGYFTDGFGKKVDCKNLVVIATSNAAADVIYEKQVNSKDLIDYLIEKKLYMPEFLNRFDGIIVYESLTTESIRKLTKYMIERVARKIQDLHHISLMVSDEYITNLVKTYYNPKFGARNMERAVRDEIEDKIAKSLLENSVKTGDIIRL